MIFLVKNSPCVGTRQNLENSPFIFQTKHPHFFNKKDNMQVRILRSYDSMQQFFHFPENSNKDPSVTCNMGIWPYLKCGLLKFKAAH